MLTPAAHSRYAHRRRRRGAGLSVAVPLASVAVLLVLIAGWRLVEAPSSSDSESPATPSVSPGVRTMVSIGASGDVHVVINLSFGAPQRDVTMQVPLREGSGVVFHPSVEILSVEADGLRQVLQKTLGVGETVAVHLDHTANQIRVEYAAAGTYVASRPAPPGRGLVLLTPLTVLESDIPFLLGVTDPRVLNLACGDSAKLRSCGSRSGDSWTADRVGSDEDVLAPVDLVPSGS